MWRNLKSPSICVQFMVFCCILNCFVAKFVFFWRFMLFCRKLGLLRFTHLCVEKILAKNSVRGEKITNMRYGLKTLTLIQLVGWRRCKHDELVSDESTDGGGKDRASTSCCISSHEVQLLVAPILLSDF